MQLTTKPTATSVWRVSCLFTSPGFEVNRVQRSNKRHILDLESLDDLEFILELANTANGNARSMVEGTVSDGDIGGVGLGTDGIVSIVHDPVAEGDE